MEAVDIRLGVDVIQFPDIKIAHPERLFQFHTVLPTQTRDHRSRDHKMIFQIDHGVSRKDSDSLSLYKASCLAVLPDCLNISGRYRPVEQELFRRFAMFDLVNIIICFQ